MKSETAHGAVSLDRSPADGDGFGRALALVALAIVTSAVVAAVTKDLRLLHVPSSLGDAAVWVRLSGVLAVGAGVWTLVVQRRRGGDVDRRAGDPTMGALRSAATIMVVVALIALLNPPARSMDDSADGSSFGALGGGSWGDGLDGEVLEANTRGGEPLVRGDPVEVGEEVTSGPLGDTDQGLLDRLAGSLPRLLLLVVLAMAFMALTRRKSRSIEADVEPDLAPAEAEAGLAASLDELVEPGFDSGGQITNAYRRLLEALTEAGAPREPYEAPHEHLDRVLGPLGVPPAPLHRLAGLYVLAQFGGRPVTDGDRASAAEAVETSLASLRAHAGIAGTGSSVFDVAAALR